MEEESTRTTEEVTTEEVTTEDDTTASGSMRVTIGTLSMALVGALTLI